MGASGVQAGRRRPAVPVALVAVITALAIAVATAGLTALAGPANAQATWPTVQRGDNGLNVQAAQNLLVADGHSIDADGVFGPATDSAARAFQTANDLDSDGVVGGDTWQALVVEVGSGDQGTAVLAMQVLLNKHGYGLEVDGIFGARSLTALEAFQDDAGLPSAGVADPGTWQQLAGLQGQTYVLPLTRHIVLRDAYGRPHHDYPAVDIPLAEGNDAFATFGGTVQIINDSLCGRGVAIEGGGDGARYAYCHFSDWSVFNGQVVEAGQKIGDSGNTGQSTGPHLHFGIFVNGVSRCPQQLLHAIYDGGSVPPPSGLPTTGCTF